MNLVITKIPSENTRRTLYTRFFFFYFKTLVNPPHSRIDSIEPLLVPLSNHVGMLSFHGNFSSHNSRVMILYIYKYKKINFSNMALYLERTFNTLINIRYAV